MHQKSTDPMEVLIYDALVKVEEPFQMSVPKGGHSLDF